MIAKLLAAVLCCSALAAAAQGLASVDLVKVQQPARSLGQMQMDRDFAKCRLRMYDYQYVVKDRTMHFDFIHECMVAMGWVAREACILNRLQALPTCYASKLPPDAADKR